MTLEQQIEFLNLLITLLDKSNEQTRVYFDILESLNRLKDLEVK